MSAWISLTKKELRLGFPAFLVPVIVFFIIAGISAYIGYRHGGFFWEAVTIVAVFATGLLVFYLTYYLLHSLNKERHKLHLWLHNPLPGASLLLAKVVAGLVFMVITLLVTGTAFLLAITLSEHLTDFNLWPYLVEVGFLGGSHLFLLGMTFAVWFLLLWMIFLWVTRSWGIFPSFVFTFLVFSIIGSLYGWFSTLPIYTMLTSWGEIHLSDIMYGLQFTFGTSGVDLITETGQFSLYLGTYVFGVMITTIMFVAACWILDRKVEV